MNNQKIEDKIREAADKIQVPDSLSPKEMEKRLEGRKQNQKKFASTWQKALMTAASFALILVAGMGAYELLNLSNGTGGTVVTEEYVEIGDSFPDSAKTNPKDYEELCRQINKLQETTYGVEDFTMSNGETKETENFSDMAATSSRQSASFSETDLQVEGIMEADVVKTDGAYIYTLSNISRKNKTISRVQIFSVNGKNVKKVAKIELPDSSCSEMYLEGKTLILIGANIDTPSLSKYETEDGCVDMLYCPRTTSILFYDVSTPENPKELCHLSQSGNYNTSRVVDGYLYTFSNYFVYDSKVTTEDLETFVPRGADSFIPANKIKISGKEDAEYMVMTSLKIAEPQKFTDCAALLGGGNTQYMNENHIYSAENYYENGKEFSHVTKYTYENGQFTYNGKAKVQGNIYDSYYMHEYNGNFVFVYTNYNEKKDTTTNGLCVLNDKLELIGEIDNLGVDETIYASYFIDNMAYFVTFRNTDPVFAVDISNPWKPKLCSELKLPGFSSYLHSFGENQLVGIGNGNPNSDDTNQVKLSLFTMDENNKLTESDTVFPRKKSATGHYADLNHKCVFVDEERGLVGFMLYYPDVYENDTERGEYVVYKEVDGALKEVFSCSLKMGMEESGENIRGLRIGEYFYIVMPQAGEIKVVEMNKFGF